VGTSTFEFEPVLGWGQAPAVPTYREVSDVAVGLDNEVYVLSRGPARVLVFDSAGSLLRTWGEDTLGQRPHGITIAPDGSVYCVDEFEHIVRRFTPAGEPLGTIGTAGVPSDTGVDFRVKGIYERTATIARSAGPFNHPTALAIAPNGDLYVTDGYGNARVHRFDAEGTLLESWGDPGVGAGEFHVPHALCIDERNRLLVADRENERIQVFTLGGKYVEEWTDVQRPAGIVIGPDGMIYVAELSRRTNHKSWTRPPTSTDLSSRLSVLDPDGRVLARVGAEDDPYKAVSLTAAHGIALDGQGDVYVAEVTFTSLLTRQEPEAREPQPSNEITLKKFHQLGS
jgi:DNA-binding beta-propeller fold protein YncE